MFASAIRRLSLLFLFSFPYLGSQANWPGWRGPQGDGSSQDTMVPLTWNLDNNLAWKVSIPGQGHASPIVWDDSIFLVAADPDTQYRLLLKLDLETGRTLWSRKVIKTPFEHIHKRNSRASSTPTTDGESIFVSFLDKDSMFIAAYDFEGNKLWEKRPGVFSSVHGYCSSPVLWKDSLIVNGDHDGEAYLVAMKRYWRNTLENATPKQHT